LLFEIGALDITISRRAGISENARAAKFETAVMPDTRVRRDDSRAGRVALLRIENCANSFDEIQCGCGLPKENGWKAARDLGFVLDLRAGGKVKWFLLLVDE